MEDMTMTDSASTESQEVVATTEPVGTIENESQTNAWDEDFDVNDGPKQETATEHDSKPDAPVEESDTKELDYVTSGLGKLDKALVVKVKGKTYDLTDLDQIRNLVEKGFGATQKYQELADMKRELEKSNNPNMSDDELDAQGVGNQIDSISQEILGSPIAKDFQDMVSIVPADTLKELRINPSMLNGLKSDFESGLAQKIMPKISRYIDVDGMSFKAAYIKAGREVQSSSKQHTQQQHKRELLEAVPSNSTSVDRVEKKDIWSMSDSEWNSLKDTERR